jgi:hypothetical protein
MIPVPVPYSDELFFGTLCRLYARIGKPAVTSFCKTLLGAATANPGTTIPLHLDKLERQLPEGYPLDAAGILQRHSLAPFSLGFASWSGRQKCPVVTTLKSCPRCRKDDARTKGESYWHILHQLEGVNYCPKHSFRLERALVSALVQTGGRAYRPSFHLPSETNFEPAGGGNKKVQLHFCEMVGDILAGKALSGEDRLAGLRGELERQGYTSGRHIDGWKVLEAGAKRFGDEMTTLYHIPPGDRGRRTITNVATGADPDPHRTLFLHALLKLPVWKRVEPARMEPREPQRARTRWKPATPSTVARRKAFLKLIKGRLPGEISGTAAYQEMQNTDGKWLRALERNRKKKRDQADSRRATNDPSAAAEVRRIARDIMCREGKPVWIRRGTILREAGPNRRLIETCTNEPMTRAALAEAVETRDEAIKRRIDWANTNLHKPMADYEFKCFAGLRGLKDIPRLPKIPRTKVVKKSG